jgi:hypothetical protein
MLNDYSGYEPPRMGGKVNYIHRTNDKADAEKFYNVELAEGYFFSCDDDLIYPKDYVSLMIAKIEHYKRKAVICWHGSIFSRRRPFTSYYYNRLEIIRCLEDNEHDTTVDVAGTGASAFHADTLKLKYSDFEKPYMADIYFAIQTKKQNVPIICARHKALEYLKAERFGQTIWDHQNGNDKEQTRLCNLYF